MHSHLKNPSESGSPSNPYPSASSDLSNCTQAHGNSHPSHDFLCQPELPSPSPPPHTLLPTVRGGRHHTQGYFLAYRGFGDGGWKMDGWIRRLIILEMDLQLIMPNGVISNVFKRESYYQSLDPAIGFPSPHHQCHYMLQNTPRGDVTQPLWATLNLPTCKIPKAKVHVLIQISKCSRTCLFVSGCSENMEVLRVF
jgi:hypothetical protein